MFINYIIYIIYIEIYFSVLNLCLTRSNLFYIILHSCSFKPFMCWMLFRSTFTWRSQRSVRICIPKRRYVVLIRWSTTAWLIGACPGRTQLLRWTFLAFLCRWRIYICLFKIETYATCKVCMQNNIYIYMCVYNADMDDYNYMWCRFCIS